MEISIDSQHVIAKKSNFLSSPKLQKTTRITCSVMFSPEILKKSPVSTLDIRVLLKDPSMEDAQRLRLLGFGSDLPQAPGVLVGPGSSFGQACSWIKKPMRYLLMDKILHHLGWFFNPINNGIIIMIGGAGFCPSTVSRDLRYLNFCCFNIRGSQKRLKKSSQLPEAIVWWASLRNLAPPKKKSSDCVLNRQPLYPLGP